MTVSMTHKLVDELSRYNRHSNDGRLSEARKVASFENTAAMIHEEAPDYPVHCFCPADLLQRVDLFVDNFPGKVGFAVKSNGEPLVIEQLVNSRLAFFDAASLAEIELVRSMDANAVILYDNPVKSREEIRQAYFIHGVRSFALDDEKELEKIHSIIGDDPSVQLTVRFKIKGAFAAQDLNSKFGASPDQATRLLSMVDAAGYRAALTFHPGSQCYSPSAYSDFIYAAAMISEKAGVDIVMLNVGGGFPAHYENSDVPELADYFDAIRTQFNRYFDSESCELVCEPGRALVATSGSLVCRVKHRRDGNVIFLNDGIYGGFMEQLVAYFKLPRLTYRGDKLLQDELEEFTVYGPTCDSSDCFKETIGLPASIAEGDWIEFGLSGAYGSTTTTRFNGYASDQYVIVEEGSEFPTPRGIQGQSHK